jgi:hypothetical protein
MGRMFLGYLVQDFDCSINSEIFILYKWLTTSSVPCVWSFTI